MGRDAATGCRRPGGGGHKSSALAGRLRRVSTGGQVIIEVAAGRRHNPQARTPALPCG